MALEVTAEQVHKAVAGLGTNDELLVTSITKHTNEELQGVAEIYAQKYKETLVKAIKGDTSGNYKDILVGLVTPRIEFKAEQLYDAVRGLGTNEKALNDILAHASNDELTLIKGFYASKYKKALDAAISSDTSGYLQKALVTLLQASRREDEIGDATASAEHFHKQVQTRGSELDGFLIEFFTKHSFSHIYATDEAYRARFGHSLLEVVVNHTIGDLRDLFSAIITRPEQYWAHRIHEAIKGAGTDNKVIVRAFALHNHHQLSKIGNEYVAKYGQTLQKAVENDTSGWFRVVLLSLLNASGHA